MDDDRDAADSLALLLEPEGHDVLVAYDGHEAVRKAQDLLSSRPERSSRRLSARRCG